MNMKKIVIVVVVLAVILLVAPFGIGKVAEGRVNRGLDKLVEQAPYIQVAERKWTGGWFKSEQLVTFKMSDAWADFFGKKAMGDVLADENAQADAAMDAEGMEEAPMPEGDAPVADATPADGESPADGAPPADPAAAVKDFSFTVRNEILHGPVLGLSGFGLARVDHHLVMSDETRKKIEEVFGSKPALEASTRVGFFGGGTTTLKSDGRTLTDKDDGTEVTYDTFKLAVGYSKNFDSYDMDGKLPSVTAKKSKDGPQVFSLKDMTLEGDAKRVVGDLYDGDFAFRVKEMNVNAPDAPDAVAIKDVHYIVGVATKDDFSDVVAQFGSGAITSKQFAAMGVDVKEIHYNFSLRHLHAPTLDKLTQSWKTAYAQPAADAAAVEAAVFNPFKEHGTELLKHDPVFGIDRIGLVTPDGEVVATGVIKLVGATAEDFSGAGGPMGLIGKLDADINISADIKAVEKFPNGAQAVEGAVQSGYAEKKDGKLICKIVFKNGALTVNGKPQGIPGLGGPPPGAMEGEGAMDPNAMPMPPQE
jgi:uncharacterized protein YdgA (DUF945 family)